MFVQFLAASYSPSGLSLFSTLFKSYTSVYIPCRSGYSFRGCQAYDNHSRKRSAPITDTFFTFRGCPLTRASTVVSK